MHRLLFSTGNILISLLIGAIALAFVGINFPELLDSLITAAGHVKGWLVGTSLPSKYNVWVRLLLEEKQLVFMFFTILSRIVLSLLSWVLIGLWVRLMGERPFA